VTYFLKFWDPFHILETVEARNFKVGTQMATGDHISRTVEARNFKFGRQIEHGGPN